MRPRPASTIACLICSCFAGACNPLEFVGEIDKAQKQQAVLDRSDRMLASARGRDALLEMTTKVLLAGADELEQVQSIGPTPALDACCRDDAGTCRVSEADWDHPTWKALQFSPASVEHFSFSIERTDTTITLVATADLDCDGTRQTHRVVGTPDARGVYDFTDVVTENADE